jgi:hypothetical protein
MQEKKGGRDTIHCRVEIKSYLWRGGGEKILTGWRSYLILEGRESRGILQDGDPTSYWRGGGAAMRRRSI